MTQTINFHLNGQAQQVQADPNMPLLWLLRDTLGLKGTKPGCLQGVCGACTVHLDGQPVRACLTPVGGLHQRHVTTIEGLGSPVMARLQSAWTTHQALQCGYCQPGQAMTAAALLQQAAPAPSASDIASAMAGHLCRCGTYPRVLAAVTDALATMTTEVGTTPRSGSHP